MARLGVAGLSPFGYSVESEVIGSVDSEVIGSVDSEVRARVCCVLVLVR